MEPVKSFYGPRYDGSNRALNRYIYGGYGFGNPAAFDDVYILSLPSFTWIKGYPLAGGDTNQFGHGGCTANVMNPDQSNKSRPSRLCNMR
jgi:hypothetical protein